MMLGLCVSCAKDGSRKSPVEKKAGFSFISSGIATKTEWDFGEHVTVEWKDADIVGITGAVGGNVFGNNCPYAVKPDPKDPTRCSFVPEDPDNFVKFNPSPDVEFYACFPYRDVKATGYVIPASIPENQVQPADDETSGLGDVCLLCSRSQGAASDGSVNLSFVNMSPVLELSVAFSSSASVDVPLKEIRLVSASGGALSYPEAEVDFSSSAPVLRSVSKSSQVRLSLPGNVTLKRGATSKFYFAIAPESHVSGDVSVEVVAIDNSVATVALTGDVSIGQGKVYRKSISISTTDFVAANPFAVVGTEFSGKAGQPVRFDFTGYADNVVLFSGVKGHDYAFKDVSRQDRAESMNLSFTMRGDPSGSNNDFNPSRADLSYSTDFNGTMDEASMNAASWTDITSNFTTPTVIKTDTPSGEYDIMPLYPSDKDDIFVRFEYKFKAGTAAVGRTVIYVKAFDVTAKHSGFDDVAACSLTSLGWNAILPASNDGGAKVNVPGTNLQFTAGSWKPAADGQAWAIAKLPVYMFNLGKDVPEDVKTSSQDMPSSFEYVYPEPGKYTAVFVVRSATIFGDTESLVTVSVDIE